jgi:DNA-binding MarR family transcriptional regulator
MTEHTRVHLAKRIVASLPKYGSWADTFRDFETPYGKLGFRQLAILWMIRYDVIPPDDLSPSRIATHYRVQRSVITRALAKLEAGRFIVLTVDLLDARVFRLTLTDQGRAVSEFVEEYFDAEVLEGLAGLSDLEVAELGRSVEILDRLADDLLNKGHERSSGCQSDPEK